MTLNGWLQIGLIFVLALATVRPLGLYMAAVFEGRRTFLNPVLQPVERQFFALAGVDENREQSWFGYATALLVFNAAGFVLLYAILRLQHLLPWNPQSFDPMSAHLAFNTAASFISNTNWQSYGGESTLRHETPLCTQRLAMANIFPLIRNTATLRVPVLNA